MHKIEYTTISKLILRASKKVNGGRTVASARWSLAMRGRELTALLDEHRRRQRQSLPVGRLRVTFIRPPKFDLQFGWGTPWTASQRAAHRKQQPASQKQFARSYNVRLDQRSGILMATRSRPTETSSRSRARSSELSSLFWRPQLVRRGIWPGRED